MLFPYQIYHTRESESYSVVSNSSWPHWLYSPWNSPGRVLEWVAFPFSRGSYHPRDQTQVSYTAGRFFISWATRGTKNTGVGSLSLFQQIFLTQELNQGLLYCRQILYQLSCQGSPISYIGIIYAYEKLDSKVFASVKSHEGFTDLAYTLLPIFPWFWNISKQKSSMNHSI